MLIREYEKDDYEYDDDIIVVPAMINGRPVTSIGHKSFSDADMSEIYLPQTVSKIESEAFQSCSNLREINIPSKVEILADSVFYGCNNLESIVLNEGLKTICSNALFENNIKKLVIPSSVDFIETQAIYPSYRPIHILFKGNNITLDFAAFSSPAVFYYNDVSILESLNDYINNSDNVGCSINHNVDDFYSA